MLSNLQMKEDAMADAEKEKKSMEIITSKLSVVQQGLLENSNEWTCMVSFAFIKNAKFQKLIYF